jgi:argininosuccinate lyase
MEEINVSIDVDRHLYAQDIAASKAHAAMLAAHGIITASDAKNIGKGLDTILSEIGKGSFDFKRALEDIHMNVESRLAELIGPAAGRLHTARSRNDQVATDFRLYVRDTIDDIDGALLELQRALVERAAEHAATVMPGFTHLQTAQPVTFGHHLLAYVAMLERDRERFSEIRRRVNRLPLGAAALAGTSFPIQRERVARELGFEGVCENSLDAVSDRDFAIESCGAAALAMMHLSRLSEEIVLWSSPRFGFVRLPDRYCTGSSIMPQKKNPDVPELVRGKSGRVVGALMSLLVLMKAQPLAYNKDNQEDKEPLFDAVDTLKDSLAVFAGMVEGMAPVPKAMREALDEGHATATDLADYLVRKGVPFRDAHEVVARAVREAERLDTDLARLPLATLKRFSPRIGADVKAVLTAEGSVAARNHIGGTAPAQVKQAAARARKRLGR